MEQLPLDFSQPTNKLTAIADVERKKNLVKNDYNQQGNTYSATNPDAMGDGDSLGYSSPNQSIASRLLF